MYPDEYEEYRKFLGKKDEKTKEEKRKFKEELELKKEKRRLGKIESINEEWFSNEPICNIYVNYNITEPLGVAYRKQEKFFKTYKRLPKPIVISQNRFLLDGFITILLGKYNFCDKNIKIIVLENVCYHGFY
jgi:hypothetical protein